MVKIKFRFLLTGGKCSQGENVHRGFIEICIMKLQMALSKMGKGSEEREHHLIYFRSSQCHVMPAGVEMFGTCWSQPVLRGLAELPH